MKFGDILYICIVLLLFICSPYSFVKIGTH
nr:MAG TPA: protein of unknown function (DUF4083) [Caudoviricetes sp.]